MLCKFIQISFIQAIILFLAESSHENKKYIVVQKRPFSRAYAAIFHPSKEYMLISHVLTLFAADIPCIKFAEKKRRMVSQGENCQEAL